MTPITLTRFDMNPRSYSFFDAYRACWKSSDTDSCHSVAKYMTGLIQQMKRYTTEPAAWSFSEWRNTKATNNTLEYWQSATAIVLEYRGKDHSQVATDLYEKAQSLGYAFILMDSLSRKGEQTVTIIFPLSEAVNKEQYARLASVLSEELGQYRAAEGNMAATHLIHVDERCSLHMEDGAILAPRQKIKETEKLYQTMDPKRFEAAGPFAGVQIAEPVITHGGLFEWAETAQDKAQRTADELLASIGVKLD